MRENNDEEKIDESKKNTGRTIRIDLMKMLHHSIDYNNTTYFLTSLNPKTAVITGYESWFNARERDCLPNTKVYATATDSAAVVATFSESGIKTKYEKLEPEWYQIDGLWYILTLMDVHLPIKVHTKLTERFIVLIRKALFLLQTDGYR